MLVLVRGFRKAISLTKGFWEKGLMRAIGLVICLMLSGGVVVTLIEKGSNEQFRSIGDGIWCLLITMTTTGYGDKVPETAPGKVATGIFLLLGVITVSLLTGTIASVMTERKIKEGRGLEKVREKRHIIVCGWNHNAEGVIDSLNNSFDEAVVLINQLPEEVMNEVLYRYRGSKVKYVRGDFVQETVLRRANVAEASAAIILADTHGMPAGLPGVSRTDPDERTILTTLAIRSIEPEVKVCAELLDPENEQHLRRADADEIIVRGKHSSFLLCAAAISPGINQVVDELFVRDDGNRIQRIKVPPAFIGKTFDEFSSHLREKYGAILIGFISEEKEMGLEDILTEDYSAIDIFIRQKFNEAGKELKGAGGKVRINLNPDSSYTISEGEWAVIIAKTPHE